MSSLFHWKKNLNITEKEHVYKVIYLGNVQTSMMKGDGCADKPVSIIWNNYLKNSNNALDMELVVTASGLSAFTTRRGSTLYRPHRISYYIVHPRNDNKVFVWIYRHEGKKRKCDFRCHAVLCKSDAMAKALTVDLREKLDFALKEFKREKTRMEISRFTLQRAKSVPHSGSTRSSLSVLPLRKQLLSTGQNFKPSISKCNTAPKLESIAEDNEIEDENKNELCTEIPEEVYDFHSKDNGLEMETLSGVFPTPPRDREQFFVKLMRWPKLWMFSRVKCCTFQ